MADKNNQQLVTLIEANSSDWIDQVPAVLGDLNGEVNAGGSLVYARFDNGLPFIAVNYIAPLIFDLHVLVGRNKAQSGYYQVIAVRETYVNPVSDFVKYHHEQHEYPAADTTWMDRKQVLPLTVLVNPSAPFTVRVYGAIVHTKTQWALVETQDLDLSEHIPVTGFVYITIEVNNEGVLSVNVGDSVASQPLATVDKIPQPETWDKTPLAAILLHEGMEELVDNDVRVLFPIQVSQIITASLVGQLLGVVTFQEAFEVLDTHTHVDLIPTTRWEPLANGDPSDPQLVFSAEGDVIMVEMEL